MDLNGSSRFGSEDQLQRLFELVQEQRILQREISAGYRTLRGAEARLVDVKRHLDLLRKELSRKP